MTKHSTTELLEMTTDIVSSFVANNPVPAGGLPDLMKAVHETVLDLASDAPKSHPAQTQPCRFQNRSRPTTSSAWKMVAN